MKRQSSTNSEGINYVLIGNPGVGKSTVLNGFVGKVAFKNGPCYTGGLTKVLQEHWLGQDCYMDTPGLADVELRKQAAEAITQAMKKGGKFKIIFVLQLIEGRATPADVTTMKLVLESAPIQQYGIIFNKLEEEHYDALTANEDGAMESVIAQFKEVKPVTAYHYLMKRQSKIAGKKDAVPEIDNELKNFIFFLPEVEIQAKDVKDIKADQYEHMIEKFEKMMEQLRIDKELLRQTIEEQKEEFKEKLEEQKRANDFKVDKLKTQLATSSSSSVKRTKVDDIIDGAADAASLLLPGIGGTLIKGFAPVAKGLFSIFGL